MTGIMKDAYVTIEVSDIGRAIRFYTGVLGLKRAKKWGDYWAELQAPGMFIALHATDERHPKKVGSGNVSLGFDVGDLDGAPKSLEKKKVKAKLFEEEWGRWAEFTDPDGTFLYFWEGG